MTKQQNSIKCASELAEELRQLSNSLAEHIKDVESMTEAWKEVDKFYQTAESLRNRQTSTGSKSLPSQPIFEGHTKFLQGLDLPIAIESRIEKNGDLSPSKVYKMHIKEWDGKRHLLITPFVVGG